MKRKERKGKKGRRKLKEKGKKVKEKGDCGKEGNGQVGKRNSKDREGWEGKVERERGIQGTTEGKDKMKVENRWKVSI